MGPVRPVGPVTAGHVPSSRCGMGLCASLWPWGPWGTVGERGGPGKGGDRGNSVILNGDF